MVGKADSLVLVGLLLGVLLACKQEQLSDGGAKVAISPSAPVDSGWEPGSCKALGYIVGRGGGSFGGGWIANEDLIEYAMNDLRNQATERGANFVQHDPPTMGQAGDQGSTTTTATVSGTAYHCERKGETRQAAAAPPASVAAKPVESAKAEQVCVPGSTQACIGPAACAGGQSCNEAGTGFTPCDCGATKTE